MRTSEPRDRTTARDGASPAVVGRDAEIGAIEGFLARSAAGPAALVFEGAAGIGKTTGWAYAHERALSARATVLSIAYV